MKTFITVMLFCSPSFAQFPDMAKDFAKQAIEACKDDRSNVSGCESYTEMKPLKDCLMKNKEKLSMKCKTALKLVK